MPWNLLKKLSNADTSQRIGPSEQTTTYLAMDHDIPSAADADMEAQHHATGTGPQKRLRTKLPLST